jgi:hypothetical protein
MWRSMRRENLDRYRAHLATRRSMLNHNRAPAAGMPKAAPQRIFDVRYLFPIARIGIR